MLLYFVRALSCVHLLACVCVFGRQGIYGVREFIRKHMCISWLVRDRMEMNGVSRGRTLLNLIQYISFIF